MKIAFTIIFTAFLLAGCGAGPSVIINKKYKDKNFDREVMLIAPIAKNAVRILNKDDVADDFSEDKREPENIIRDFTYRAIVQRTGFTVTGLKFYKSKLDSSFFLSNNDSLKYFAVTEVMGKDSAYKFYVPRKEALNSTDIKTDLVLVINSLTFGRNFSPGMSFYVPGNTISTPGGSFTTPGHFSGGGSSEYLGANVNFIIYDYNENDVIAYGNLTIQCSFLFAMTRSTWNKIFDSIGKEIVDKTPSLWAPNKYANHMLSGGY